MYPTYAPSYDYAGGYAPVFGAEREPGPLRRLWNATLSVGTLALMALGGWAGWRVVGAAGFAYDAQLLGLAVGAVAPLLFGLGASLLLW